MQYSFYDFLMLIGSLGLFLYGMKIMSEGLQKVAGDRLRSILTAMVASALKAENLLLLTAVPGLMKNFPDESTLIRQLPQSQLVAASEAAQGRMKKKVLGAEEALKGGVSRVIIADGRIQNPISNALAGNGTIIQ